MLLLIPQSDVDTSEDAMPSLIMPSSVVGGGPLNTSDLLRLQHTIPPYQRDYVWNEKVVEELWNDFIDHYRRLATNEQLAQPEGYFLGAMVVVGDGDEHTFEVVDGQQRLTSLSIMLSVLLDNLQNYAVPDAARAGYGQLARECLGRFVGGTYETNLTFSDPDVETFFLNSCILQDSRAAKEAYWLTPWCMERLARKNTTIYRIKQALEIGYSKLTAFLAEPSDAALQAERLMTFFRLVTECVVLLRIRAHSHSNAYAIFESLNNRGVRLSQADLIKNELLKTALLGEKDEVGENWAFVRQNVNAADILSMPEFLHFSYLSRFDKVKANTLFVSVKALLGGARPALAYSKELYEDGEALDALTANFDASWTQQTLAMLKDIMNVLGIKLCYPYLFAAWRKARNAPGEFEDHVRLVMNLAFRYLKVLEGSLESLTTAINQGARLVNEGKPTSDVAQVFRALAPDTLFKDKFETVSFQNTKLAYFAVYYLESVRLHGTVPLPHSQESNLEHIMPRTPTAAQWPEVYQEKVTNPELFKEYLWRVGNLLPLPEDINKALKNKSIAHKMSNGTGKEYSSPGLSLMSPKEIGNYLQSGSWTYQSIVERQKALAAIACSAWRL